MNKYYDFNKIIPEFASPGYQFLVFFRSLWCKEKCSCGRFNFLFFWKERKACYYKVTLKWKQTVQLLSYAWSVN